MKLTKTEIENQFELMVFEAKKLIDKGEDVQGLCFGIGEATARMGGSNIEHAPYCVEEGKRRITELVKYSQQEKLKCQ